MSRLQQRLPVTDVVKSRRAGDAFNQRPEGTTGRGCQVVVEFSLESEPERCCGLLTSELVVCLWKIGFPDVWTGPCRYCLADEDTA